MRQHLDGYGIRPLHISRFRRSLDFYRCTLYAGTEFLLGNRVWTLRNDRKLEHSKNRRIFDSNLFYVG